MVVQSDPIQTIFGRNDISRSASQKHPTRWQRRIAPAGLAALLTLTGGWLMVQAIVPAAVQAYTGRVNVALDVQPGETYEALMRRAEVVARAAAQRSFDRDILITDVFITVSAQNESNIAPVLTLEATRTQWRSIPDPHRWATYYRSSRSLLGLDRVPATTATSPALNPTTQTPTNTIPNSAPSQPSNAPSGSPYQPPFNGNGASPNPADEVPGTPPPPNAPILPNRILTPGGIGK